MYIHVLTMRIALVVEHVAHTLKTLLNTRDRSLSLVALARYELSHSVNALPKLAHFRVGNLALGLESSKHFIFCAIHKLTCLVLE